MKRVMSLMVIIFLLGPLLIGCDGTEKKNPGSTTDESTPEVSTTEAIPSLVDLLNAEKFINVTMQMKLMDLQEGDSEIICIKFTEEAVEYTVYYEYDQIIVTDPTSIAESRGMIDMWRVPFLDAANSGKFIYDQTFECFRSVLSILHVEQESDEISSYVFDDVIIQVGSNGLIDEMTMTQVIDGTSGIIEIKLFDYSCTVIKAGRNE